MSLRVIKYDPQATFNLIAALDIGEGQLVGINTAGTASLADGDGTQGAAVADKAIGVAVKAAKSGAMVAVAPICTVDGFSTLTKGAPCYLDTTAGGITQTKTSTNGQTIQHVGVARTATEILFNVHEPTLYQTAGNSTLTSY
jgi:hypothetical protein